MVNNKLHDVNELERRVFVRGSRTRSFGMDAGPLKKCASFLFNEYSTPEFIDIKNAINEIEKEIHHAKSPTKDLRFTAGGITIPFGIDYLE